ncbi:YciI family protein [Actinoplanes sp. KI2]|uniref:YciI family protein n=1 Tax=Actinoplanes sp. KI2 TaxID=2983315 RepID=UPI0021D5F65D|nr:YciI family protein [Actinoplanes sp. KI2]MCU7726107.1 YciI family protein [Actinoplanes sp. KI2]
MPRYLLIVDYRPGDVPEPMDQWKPEEVRAHMDYYAALNRELAENGELIGAEALTPPDQALEVISDGRGPAVVTDGPYAEFKETFAGYQLVEVESEARALEIAARVSAVPGPGGVPLRQPVVVRRAMSITDFDALSA